MKKIIKTVSMVSVLAVMASASVFAQKAPGERQGPAQEKERIERTEKHPAFGRMEKSAEKTIIGNVIVVNTKDNTIRLANADGKEVIVRVNPFAKVVVLKGKEVKNNIDEIHRGDWVKINVFDSDTKIKDASFVCAMTSVVDNSPENAK